MLSATLIAAASVCATLPEALIPGRGEMETLPGEEGDVLATALLAAAYLARQGNPEEGHACLRACARRAELARNQGETWAEPLAARYGEVMESFAARYGLQ